MLPAPAADAENKRAEQEQTMAPLPVEEKRPPVVSNSHIPPVSGLLPLHQPVSNSASSRPPPERTVEEDNDYDSDDASKVS